MALSPRGDAAAGMARRRFMVAAHGGSQAAEEQPMAQGLRRREKRQAWAAGLDVPARDLHSGRGAVASQALCPPDGCFAHHWTEPLAAVPRALVQMFSP